MLDPCRTGRPATSPRGRARRVAARRVALLLLPVLALAASAVRAEDVTPPGLIRIVGGRLGTQTVSERKVDITVPPGGAIRGRIRLRVENLSSTGLPMHLAATASWNEPRKSWWPIRSTVPAGTSEFDVAVDLLAPSSSGLQYVVFAMAEAKSYEQLMSGTDVGVEPDWDRGKVLARLPGAAFDMAARDGWIPVVRYRPGGGRRAGVAMAALKIFVGPSLPARVERRLRVDTRRTSDGSHCNVLFWFRDPPQPHALVFCLREDPGEETLKGQAFGIYTARDAGGVLREHIGTLPRSTVNALLDGRLEPTTHEIACRVDERQFKAAEALQQLWTLKTKRSATRDEVMTFLTSTVRELGLPEPPAAHLPSPVDYLRSLFALVEADPPKGPTPYPAVPGLSWAFVPSGTYEVGTPPDERGRERKLEILPQAVEIEGFFITTTEITQRVYARFATLPPGPHRAYDLPVHSVKWREATAFCEALSRAVPGFTFDLPTEVEWEIACRGTLPCRHGPVAARSAKDRERLRADSKENAEFVLGKYAWFGARVAGPQPVGGRTPTAWLLEAADEPGLFDMHGNLMEWCRKAPQMAWKQPGLLEEPVRGGSYLSRLERCRAGARTFVARDRRHGTVGFRVIARKK